MEKKTLLTAIREFFAMTAGECRAEYPALTDDDKRDLCAMLGEHYGCEVTFTAKAV